MKKCWKVDEKNDEKLMKNWWKVDEKLLTKHFLSMKSFIFADPKHSCRRNHSLSMKWNAMTKKDNDRYDEPSFCTHYARLLILLGLPSINDDEITRGKIGYTVLGKLFSTNTNETAGLAYIWERLICHCTKCRQASAIIIYLCNLCNLPLPLK